MFRVYFSNKESIGAIKQWTLTIYFSELSGDPAPAQSWAQSSGKSGQIAAEAGNTPVTPDTGVNISICIDCMSVSL